MKDFSEMKKEFDKSMEETHIYIDNGKVDIQGCGATLLSLYAQIAHHLLQCGGIEPKDLKKAVEIGTMNDKELKKETLNRLKNILKNLDKIEGEENE